MERHFAKERKHPNPARNPAHPAAPRCFANVSHQGEIEYTQTHRAPATAQDRRQLPIEANQR